MTGPAVPRISGRVIVVDKNERVLLFGIRDPDMAGDRRLWITPGGRIERAETPLSAAVRDLDEETGFIVDPDELGTCVACYETLWNAADGIQYQVRDEFWFLRTESFVPYTSRLEPTEREGLSMHRWWPVAQLIAAADDETIAPVGLGELTLALLSEGRPQAPIRLTD